MSKDLYINPEGRTPIRPELVAAKLAAIRNYELPNLRTVIERRPRFVEILWFLQSMSLRPGGLLKFAENLIDTFPERCGTPTMLAVSKAFYTDAERLAIYIEVHKDYRPGDISTERARFMEEDFDDLAEAERACINSRDIKLIEEGISDLDQKRFKDACRKAALDVLPGFFARLCVEKTDALDVSSLCAVGRSMIPDHVRSVAWDAARLAPKIRDPWYFDDPIGAVESFMQRHAEEAQNRLAKTEVVKLVFDRLDYALAEKVMVRIEGNSRFGKTEALASWVEMRPGLARLVRVPCDNSMQSLFRRIGEALGIDCSYGSNMSRLKERVEYVIQHGGLFLVFDEAHFLAPLNFSETTPPHRLNWIRTEIVDRGLPLGLAMTPQAFKGAIDRYVKKTRYDMTQFFGRDFLPCALPDTLSEEDLIAVARIHLPEMGESALGYIANQARLSQNYLQAVEAIARRVRYLIQKHGGTFRVRDLKTAVSEVLGGFPPQPTGPLLAVDQGNPEHQDAMPSREDTVADPLRDLREGVAMPPRNSRRTAIVTSPTILA